MATQSLSPEMTSYARLCLAINDVCTKSLRDVLLRNVPSQDIKQAIVARWGHQYNKPKFDRYPYSILFPNHQLNPNFSVSDCDLSLLYILIRNVSSVQKPLLGWGKSFMNNPQDTSIGANVERVHKLRNTVIHLQEPRLSNQEFNSYWNKLRDCVTDIDTYLGGTTYQQELEFLKTVDMDPDYANRLIETFRSSLQDLQAGQLEQDKTLYNIREKLNEGFQDNKTADDRIFEGVSEVKDLIKDQNRQLPQIAPLCTEMKSKLDNLKELCEHMKGKAKENDKTQQQLNSDHGVRTENTTSNQDEHESEITLEKHDSRDSENTTDCNKNRIEKTDVDKSSRSESLAVQVQLKTNDVLVKADHDNNGGIEIGDLASVLDGKLCITKQYAFIKSNLTRESGLVIAKCLLKQKLLSQDAYDRMVNTCCARRHPIDILLKKVIHGGKEEIVEAFFKRLKVECPLIARAVKETTNSEKDRLRFAQLEARGVETGGLFRTMWCATSGPDVRFFKYHLSESEEVVEHITDVMLSRLHFSIQDHSSIIDCPTSDDRISVLFQKMQLYKLDVVKELSDVVKHELHQKWLKFKSTQDPWWSGLFQWMKQSKPVIDGSFEFENIELKEVETGSIILKFIAGVNFSVDLLKPESLKNKIKTLLKRGCLESKTETKSVAHITVYIESPPNKDQEEIHIYIDFHATDESIEAEDHQDEMRIRNRDIMLEEINPARLKQWMLDQPCIQKSHRDMLESKLSEKGLFRQEEMTVLLDFINGLENGDHLLEKYCEKNDLYVYNKVFRKHQESHSQQEISGHRAAVTYVKGGSLQELFSFSIIFNDEDIDPDTEEVGLDNLNKVIEGFETPSNSYYNEPDLFIKAKEQQKDRDRAKSSIPPPPSPCAPKDIHPTNLDVPYQPAPPLPKQMDQAAVPPPPPPISNLEKITHSSTTSSPSESNRKSMLPIISEILPIQEELKAALKNRAASITDESIRQDPAVPSTLNSQRFQQTNILRTIHSPGQRQNPGQIQSQGHSKEPVESGVETHLPRSFASIRWRFDAPKQAITDQTFKPQKAMSSGSSTHTPHHHDPKRRVSEPVLPLRTVSADYVNMQTEIGTVDPAFLTKLNQPMLTPQKEPFRAPIPNQSSYPGAGSEGDWYEPIPPDEVFYLNEQYNN